MSSAWRDIVSPSASDETPWEQFHENSKISRLDPPIDEQQMGIWTQQVSEGLTYANYPAIELPATLAPLEMSLGEALTTRVTPEDGLTRLELELDELASLLYAANGVTREPMSTRARRALRTIPSAGALHSLEVYLHTRATAGLDAGIYHYNPLRHELRRLKDGDHTARIASSLVQKTLAVDASVMLMIAATFEKSTAKYGDRGYRFVLLEAGHMLQNVCLAASALGLGCIPVGGYFDRQIDGLLGFDGLLQSTVYLAALGGLAVESHDDRSGQDGPGQ